MESLKTKIKNRLEKEKPYIVTYVCGMAVGVVCYTVMCKGRNYHMARPEYADDDFIHFKVLLGKNKKIRLPTSK